MNMTYREIMPGVMLRVLETDRFKTCCLSVELLSELTAESASKNALIPRVLRRGSLKHPDMESLAAALDDMYGAQIEPVVRKYGNIQASGFVCDFVEAEEKLFPEVAKLLGEVIFEPKLKDGVFLSEYVEGERDNLIDEIKSEINNKLHYAHRRAVGAMFEGNGCAIREIGNEEEAEKIDASTLFRHYKGLLASSPVEVFFCGNYSFDEAAAIIKKMLALCERGAIRRASANVGECAQAQRITQRLDIAQANLLVGLQAPNADVYTAKLLATVLGGGTSSKLFVNVRERESLCYFAGATFDSVTRAMFMYCGIDPKNAKIAENALDEQLRQCISGNITDEEIKNAKKSIIDDFVTVEDSPFSLESFWLRATIIKDSRAPLEVASAIKAIDGAALSAAAGEFRQAIVYLLTGMEDCGDETKLLPKA